MPQRFRALFPCFSLILVYGMVPPIHGKTLFLYASQNHFQENTLIDLQKRDNRESTNQKVNKKFRGLQI